MNLQKLQWLFSTVLVALSLLTCPVFQQFSTSRGPLTFEHFSFEQKGSGATLSFRTTIPVLALVELIDNTGQVIRTVVGSDEARREHKIVFKSFPFGAFELRLRFVLPSGDIVFSENMSVEEKAAAFSLPSLPPLPKGQRASIKHPSYNELQIIHSLAMDKPRAGDKAPAAYGSDEIHSGLFWAKLIDEILPNRMNEFLYLAGSSLRAEHQFIYRCIFLQVLSRQSPAKRWSWLQEVLPETNREMAQGLVAVAIGVRGGAEEILTHLDKVKNESAKERLFAFIASMPHNIDDWPAPTVNTLELLAQKDTSLSTYAKKWLNYLRDGVGDRKSLVSSAMRFVKLSVRPFAFPGAGKTDNWQDMYGYALFSPDAKERKEAFLKLLPYSTYLPPFLREALLVSARTIEIDEEGSDLLLLRNWLEKAPRADYRLPVYITLSKGDRTPRGLLGELKLQYPNKLDLWALGFLPKPGPNELLDGFSISSFKDFETKIILLLSRIRQGDKKAGNDLWQLMKPYVGKEVRETSLLRKALVLAVKDSRFDSFRASSVGQRLRPYMIRARRKRYYGRGGGS